MSKGIENNALRKQSGSEIYFCALQSPLQKDDEKQIILHWHQWPRFIGIIQNCAVYKTLKINPYH